MTPEPETAADTDISVDDPPLPDASAASIAFSAFLAVLAAGFFVRSLSIDSDAETWPKMLSAILFLLAAGHLVRSLVARVRQGSALVVPVMSERLIPRLFTAAWLVAFAVVARLTGFGIATLVFIPVYMLASGYRSPIWIGVVTAFAAGTITYLFGEVIGVPIWEARL